jgi:hypothetical protein
MRARSQFLRILTATRNQEANRKRKGKGNYAPEEPYRKRFRASARNPQHFNKREGRF